MAIARVQTKFGGGDGAQGTSIATGNFASPVTAGNTIIVFIRDSGLNATDIPTPTDTLGNTYTLIAKNLTGGFHFAVFYSVLATGGTDSVTCNFGATTDYPFIYAIEVSGLSSTPLDTSSVSATTQASATITAAAITTAQAAEYIVLGCSQDNFAHYTAGTSFTLVDGNFPANTNDFGGIEEFITTSTQTSFQGTITTDLTTSHASITIVAAFKGSTGSAQSRNSGSASDISATVIRGSASRVTKWIRETGDLYSRRRSGLFVPRGFYPEPA
jgi:hypothetical protein